MEGKSYPLDASLQLLESEETPMHVGALLTFRKPENASSDFESVLAEKLRNQSEPVPPWNYVPLRAPLNLLQLGWEESSFFEIDHHFRHLALPHPGGERELGMMVSRLHSQALDSKRPPWEVYLIEGQEGGRFSLYIKIHRALLEEAGGMDVLISFLSRSARGRTVQAPWSVSAPDNVQNSERASSGLVNAVERSVRAATDIGQAFSRLVWARVKRDTPLTVPYTAPRSALNGSVEKARRFATQQYSVERLQKLAEALDVDLETLVAYLCGSALRRFLKEYNALPDEPLIAAVPEAGIIGGKFSLAVISLGSHLADPLKRLDEVRRSVAASHRHLSALPDELRVPYSLGAALPFMMSHLAGLQQFMPAMFNLALVNLDGPEDKLYLGGAQLEALYPMSMLMPGGALTITTLRYAGTVNVGLTGARDTLPHLQRIAVYMGLALESLEALAKEAAQADMTKGAVNE